MTDTSFTQYERMPLLDITDKLQKEYYASLEAFCTQITELCVNLKRKRLTEASLNYVLLCDELAAELYLNVRHLNAILVPYLKTLADKETTNHNCGSCSGRCELNHGIKLREIKASAVAMKHILYRIKTATLKEDTVTDAGLKVLHSKMCLVDNMISELILIEETHLLPGVEKAQKHIHVAG